MKMNNFNCDSTVKQIAIDYFENLGKQCGFTMTLDSAYTFNTFSHSDLKFTYNKNNKQYKYEIEIKERSGYTYEDFPDIMFNDKKLDYLIEQNKKGIRTYFLNVFKDYDALLYKIDESTKFQTGISHQYKYTEKQCANKINEIKIYLKKEDGKRINLQLN